MFAVLSLATLALSALSAVNVNAFVVPRKEAPATYATGYLENYQVYHTRYLALGCQFQHNNQTFFNACCHPMLATETLETARPSWCIPSASASASASAAEPTSTVTTPADGDDSDCDDGDDNSSSSASSSADDDEDCDDGDDNSFSSTSSSTDDGDDGDDCDDGDDESSSSVVSFSSSVPTTTFATIATTSTHSEAPTTFTPTTSSTSSHHKASSTQAPTTSSTPVAPTTSSTPVAPTTSSTPPPAHTSSSSSAQATSTSSSSSGSQLFTGGHGTYFYQNGVAGACGTVHSDWDSIVAIDSQRYGNTGERSSLCGQTVQITANGKTETAVVADACPTCDNENSLDMSEGLFLKFADLSVGLLDIEWQFLN